jgi:hypothetical protein
MHFLNLSRLSFSKQPLTLKDIISKKTTQKPPQKPIAKNKELSCVG